MDSGRLGQMPQFRSRQLGHVGVADGAVGRELPDRGIGASERNSGQAFHVSFLISAVDENSGRVDPDDQSTRAKYMVLKNFSPFSIVDEMILEENHPILS